MSADLIVRGALVVAAAAAPGEPGAPVPSDIAIENGVIAAIAPEL